MPDSDISPIPDSPKPQREGHYRAEDDIELPPMPDGSRNTMVVGEVVGVYIADDALTDGMIDTARIKPIGRLGYTDYVVIDEVFSMTRPSVAL